MVIYTHFPIPGSAQFRTERITTLQQSFHTKMIPITKDIPPFNVYRYFSHESYKAAFLSGNLRLSWIGKYTQMETTDPRTDQTEGTGRFSTSTGNTRFVTGNSVLYIICASKIRGDGHYEVLGRRFSSEKESRAHGVEIYDPAGLTQAIQKCLHSTACHYHELFTEIFWLPVEYSKGFVKTLQETIITSNNTAQTTLRPDDYPPDEFQNYQKPRRFQIEREHRLCIRVHSNAEHHRNIDRLQLSGEAFNRRIEKIVGVGHGQLGDDIGVMGCDIPKWIDDIELNIPDIRCFARSVSGLRIPAKLITCSGPW